MHFSFMCQMGTEFRSILHGYPRFVFERRPQERAGQMPVFIFHSIEPGSFEAQLIYLKKNGYRTLSVDEFVDCMEGRGQSCTRSILLTVDDGRSSFWRFGYPLLEKFQMKATLFIMPGWTPEAAAPRPNLIDVWNGGAKFRDILAMDPHDETLCSWPEVQQMFRSGLVSIESHTLFHKEVFVNPKLVGFIHPGTPFTPSNSPATAYLDTQDAGRELSKSDLFGLPLFKPAPLMQGLPAMKIPPETLEFCRRSYWDLQSRKQHAGNGWMHILEEQLLKRKFLSNPDYQEDFEVLDALRHDLDTARTLIRKKVHPEAGNHLCLPYCIGSKAAVETARALGIKSCFWGPIKGKHINTSGDDPLYTVRLKNDFIWRLPGNGRRNLLFLYGWKIKRRLGGEAGF